MIDRVLVRLFVWDRGWGARYVENLELTSRTLYCTHVSFNPSTIRKLKYRENSTLFSYSTFGTRKTVEERKRFDPTGGIETHDESRLKPICLLFISPDVIHRFWSSPLCMYVWLDIIRHRFVCLFVCFALLRRGFTHHATVFRVSGIGLLDP